MRRYVKLNLSGWIVLALLLTLRLFLLRHLYILDVVRVHEVLMKRWEPLIAKLRVWYAHEVGIWNGYRNQLAVLTLRLR